MIYRLGGQAALIGALLLAAGSGQAAVQCPSTNKGNPLLALGGVDVFEGPPEAHVQLAPAPTRPSSSPQGWLNTWTFKNAEKIVIVCHYKGKGNDLQIPLTASIKTCTQTPIKFVCN